MTIALCILCALLIGALVLQDWRHSQETRVREDAWRLERSALLNRIQAPEVAVVESLEDDEEPQYAHFEDDDHFAV